MLIKEDGRELAPGVGKLGAPVIPVLAKDGRAGCMDDPVAVGAGLYRGEPESGRPAQTVTAKGKGSGMLRTLPRWTPFWTAYSRTEGPVSVKTRLGVRNRKFAAILEIIAATPSRS